MESAEGARANQRPRRACRGSVRPSLCARKARHLRPLARHVLLLHGSPWWLHASQAPTYVRAVSRSRDHGPRATRVESVKRCGVYCKQLADVVKAALERILVCSSNVNSVEFNSYPAVFSCPTLQ